MITHSICLSYTSSAALYIETTFTLKIIWLSALFPPVHCDDVPNVIHESVFRSDMDLRVTPRASAASE